MTIKKLLGAGCALAVLVLAAGGVVAGQNPSAGGAFLPLENYVVSGQWTFKSSAPIFQALSGVLVGNGTSAVTAVAAPTGTIVGTSDTQVLTAKTLTSPAVNTPTIVGGTSSARRLVAAYSASGAIAIADGTVTLAGGSAQAYTLAACAAGDAGTTMVITAITAQTHTVTVAAGFNNGGVATDVATFGGAIGDTLTTVCANAIWNVVVLRNVTLG